MVFEREPRVVCGPLGYVLNSSLVWNVQSVRDAVGLPFLMES
jgi:hypothetical protein